MISFNQLINQTNTRISYDSMISINEVSTKLCMFKFNFRSESGFNMELESGRGQSTTLIDEMFILLSPNSE